MTLLSQWLGKRLPLLMVTFALFVFSVPLTYGMPNPPSPPPMVPTLGTPTMDPTSPYNPNSNTPVTFTFTLSGLASNEKATMNYNIVDSSNMVKVSSFTAAPTNPLGNDTYTVTWNGKLDGGVKPTNGADYTFQVWGYYGPGNMSALGTKTIGFHITEVPPALSMPIMEPTSPYMNKMNSNGVKFTTTLSNLYAADGQAHLMAGIHKDSILNPSIITFTSNQGAGDFSVTWKDPNAAAGQYYYVVGGNYGNPSKDIDAKVFAFTVDNTITPFIDSLTVSDNTYNYSNNTTVDFGYKLNSVNNMATVNTAIYAKDNDNNAANDVLVYQWAALSNQGDGMKTITWNGKASNNSYVADGNYYFKVWGQVGNTQLDPKQIDFSVNTVVVTGPSITNLKATPSTFSPNGDNSNDTTAISLDLDKVAMVEVSTKVGNSTVILFNGNKNLGTSTFTWDGKVGNSVVADGIYVITVKATTVDGSDQETVNVTVNTQVSSNDCGYPDVKMGVGGITKEICDAFKFTKDRGIFLGDDGTGYVRPFDVINRVESGAVIMRGFDMPLLAASGTNEGFTDVLLNQWYMKTGVVRSAKQYGVFKGYPDGTLHPSQQVIRSELVVMFVRASGKIAGDVSVAPFADTPVEAGTQWYVKSVSLAKANGWIPATTNFYPVQGMTRADVAKLFFAAYNAGNAGL